MPFDWSEICSVEGIAKCHRKVGWVKVFFFTECCVVYFFWVSSCSSVPSTPLLPLGVTDPISYGPSPAPSQWDCWALAALGYICLPREGCAGCPEHEDGLVCVRGCWALTEDKNRGISWWGREEAFNLVGFLVRQQHHWRQNVSWSYVLHRLAA